MLLGLVKKIRRKRQDLRLIICSATIDAERFLDFFITPEMSAASSSAAVEPESTSSTMSKKRRRWGPKVGEHKEAAPPPQHPHANRGTIISVDGRQHSVDVLYLREAASNYIEATVDACFKIHRHESSGDILCFLPTGEDIDRSIRLAEEVFENELTRVEFLPLYGTLPQHVQSRVFQPKLKESNRRIMLSEWTRERLTRSERQFHRGRTQLQ